MKKLLSLALVLVMMLTLVACPPQPPQPPVGGGSDVFDLDYAEGTVLRMATGYNNAQTGLFFDAKIAGDGVTLADGVTYHTGDLKPTWVEVEKVLKVEFEDKYQGKKASDEWKYWEAQLGEVGHMLKISCDVNKLTCCTCFRKLRSGTGNHINFTELSFPVLPFIRSMNRKTGRRQRKS